MISVRNRPAIIGMFVFLLIVGAVAAWFVASTRNKDKSTSEEAFVSAVETSKIAIKDGVTASNASQALFIATDLLNYSKISEARSAALAISDDILSNDQLKNKYTILLDSYRVESNKDEFTKTVDTYKKVIAARSDQTLTQETSYLTQAYIDAVFTPQPVVPEGEEVP